MSRRRVIVALAALAALGAAAAAGLLAWLLGTAPGAARVLAWIDALPAVELEAEGTRGSLAGGLRIERLQLRTKRVALEATALEVVQAAPGLLPGRLSIARLQAGTAQVVIAPRDPDEPERPPRFMPRWLSASVRELKVARLAIVTPVGTQLEYRDIGATGSVSASRIVLRQVTADAGSWRAAGRLRVEAREPLRLSGELAWTLRARPDLSGTLTARGDLDRLEVAAQVTEPGRAEVGLTLEGLREGVRWHAGIALAELGLESWLREPPVGPLNGRFEARGAARDFEVTGRAFGAGLPDAGLDVAATLSRGDGEFLFRSLRLTEPGGTLAVDASGRILLDEPRRLEARAAWRDFAWPLAGRTAFTSPDGRIEISGWDRYSFTLQAAVTPADGPRVQLDAAGQADALGITVEHAALAGAAGQADGSGYLGFGPERPWRVEAKVRELDLSVIRPGLPSRLSFAIAASGLGIDESAAWAAHVGPASGRLRGWPVSGTGFVRHQPGRWDFERFTFDVAQARIDLRGRIGGGTVLDARLDAPDLARLHDDLGGRLEASLRARQALPGATGLKLDLAFKGRDLRFGEQHAAVLSGDAVLDLTDREPSWARLRAAGITVAGQELASSRLAFDGRARGHRVAWQVDAGRHTLELGGEGVFEQGTYRLHADRLAATDPALAPFSLEAPLRLVLTRDAARLEETCVVAPPRRACAEGQWQADAGWSAALTARALPIAEAALKLPGRPAFSGSVDLSFAAQGLPDRPWTGRGTVTLRDVSLSYVTAAGRDESLPLGVAVLTGESSAAEHRLTLTLRETDAMRLAARATLQRLDGRAFADSPLQAELNLGTRQLGLLPLFLPDIDRATGRLDADVALAGTVAAPQARGRLTLSDAALDVYASNLRMTGVRARIDLLDDGLDLDAAGRVGDGSFTAGGRLAWRERLMHGELRLTGERLRVADVPEARVEASPDLRLHVTGRDLRVTGSVTVPMARIEPRQLVGAVQSSLDEVIAGSDEDPTAGPGYRVAADLRLALGEDVRLDAFGLKGRLTGSVRLQSPPGEVTVGSGELEIEEGRYRAYGRELAVERGRLLFAGGPAADPGVDLRAKRAVPGYEVGVIARGRLRRPQLTLFSTPALPPTPVAARLLVGPTHRSLQNRDREALGSSRPDVVAHGGSLLAGQLNRYLGLDELSVQADADYDTSVVLGKFLSPRLYVSYGVSLTNAINTFKLRYTIGDRWLLTGETGETASADMLFTVDR